MMHSRRDRTSGPSQVACAPAVDVWYWPIRRVDHPTLLARCGHILDDGERRRLDRFAVAGAREQYLATRLLVRHVLSGYAQVAPAAWRFTADARGRPRLAGPATLPDLSFNLSNTTGLVVCAAGFAVNVGVDVEDSSRPVDAAGIVNSFFSPGEIERFATHDADTRVDQFWKLWTLKEAYLKARGLGLSVPLDQFGFRCAGGEIALELSRPAPAELSRWQFAHLRIGRHHVSLAIDCAARDARIVLRRFDLPACQRRSATCAVDRFRQALP